MHHERLGFWRQIKIWARLASREANAKRVPSTPTSTSRHPPLPPLPSPPTYNSRSTVLHEAPGDSGQHRFRRCEPWSTSRGMNALHLWNEYTELYGTFRPYCDRFETEYMAHEGGSCVVGVRAMSQPQKHAHQDQASKVRRRMVAGAPGTFQSLALADAGMAQAREGAPEGSQIRRSPSAWC